MTTHELILRDGQDWLTSEQKQHILEKPEILEYEVINPKSSITNKRSIPHPPPPPPAHRIIDKHYNL